MLQPVVRRTWAPRGRTPVHYSWDRRDRLSAISAITVSPKCCRLGLYFSIRDQNIITEDVVGFTAELLAHLQRGIIVVMDRWQVHRSAARRLRERFPRRVAVEWLPPYAPDLNPVERVWSRTKYGALANYIPDDVRQLGHAVRRSLRHTRRREILLRGFFKHAALKL